MAQLSRRHFVRTSADVAGILAAGRAPAAWAAREINILAATNYAPSSDVKLTELIRRFAKQTGVNVRFDHMQSVQMPAKLSSELMAKGGHDIMSLEMQAEQTGFHLPPAGPAGRHTVGVPRSLGIWKFSKNIEPAKEFLKWFFEPAQYHEWIVSGDNYNHPTWRDMENHAIWDVDPLGRRRDQEDRQRFLSRTSSSGADHWYGLISISAGSSTRGPMPLGQMYW